MSQPEPVSEKIEGLSVSILPPEEPSETLFVSQMLALLGVRRRVEPLMIPTHFSPSALPTFEVTGVISVPGVLYTSVSCSMYQLRSKRTSGTGH